MKRRKKTGPACVVIDRDVATAIDRARDAARAAGQAKPSRSEWVTIVCRQAAGLCADGVIRYDEMPLPSGKE